MRALRRGHAWALLPLLVLAPPVLAEQGGSDSLPSIEIGGVSSAVPPPGFRREVISFGVGWEQRVAVETGSDGVVVISFAPTADEQHGMLPAATRPCTDRAFRLGTGRWTSAYEWWFRADTVPAGLDRARTLQVLKRAMANITGSRNDCGRSDRVHAMANYQGTTTTGARSCFDGGTKSIVRFGNLPAGVTGQADLCYSFGGDPPGWITIQAHVTLNNDDYRWALSRTGCRNKMLVEAVATHEFGHVFGLEHVSQREHPWLTMSPYGAPCDASDSTLGLGDMLGLERLYP